MAYTTNQLISDAYYASGVVSKEFETVSGGQFSDALQWVNDIISDKDVNQSMVPYETTYTFTANIGQEKYFIPNLISIDTIVFYKDTVRYALTYTKRNAYFGSPRVQNINSLPFDWYFERQTNGGNLFIYFNPDQTYPFEIHGVFRPNPLRLGQDLTNNQTLVNLGVPTFFGADPDTAFNGIYFGVLDPNQLIINGIDMQGTYTSIGAFINKLDSNFVNGIRARIDVNSIVLYSVTDPPIPIYIQVSGYGTNGTRFIKLLQHATTTNLNATYNNIESSGQIAELTSNVNGVLVIDSDPVALDSYVLVKNQTNPIANGVYTAINIGSIATPWIMKRSDFYNTPLKIGIGDLFKIDNGVVNNNKTFVQTSTVIQIGISPIVFNVFEYLSFSNISSIQFPDYFVFNPDGLDQFYVSYLKFALADRICSEYNYVVPANVTKQLKEYENWIDKKSRPLDLKLQKTSTLNRQQYLGYSWFNLGRGWLSGR
jgi:hypothetical protein